MFEHAVEDVELDDALVENRTGLLELDRGVVNPRRKKERKKISYNERALRTSLPD